MTTSSHGKPKRQHKPRAPLQPERLADDKINVLDEIFPGFAEFYRKNYDSEGRYVGKVMSWLRPPTTKGEL